MRLECSIDHHAQEPPLDEEYVFRNCCNVIRTSGIGPHSTASSAFPCEVDVGMTSATNKSCGKINQLLLFDHHLDGPSKWDRNGTTADS